MRKYCIAMILVLAAALAGCAGGDGSAPHAPPSTPANTPTPTPAPDYTQTDFSGTWYVSGVIRANGERLRESDMAQLGDNFTLELLPGGAYFVYGGNGAIMGQGEYSVSQSLLTCRANGMETVYVIVDADTLQGTATDDSVTIMSRRPAEPIDDAEDMAEGEGAAEDEGVIEGEDVIVDEGVIEDEA